MKGIELNAYAAELARITVWIGEIQWMIQNGYGAKRNPILQPLDQIENRDALMTSTGVPVKWPQASVAIGNPPFIGDKKMMGELGADYTEALRKAYAGKVPGGADFVCYWFEKANDAIRAGTMQRAGFVATNSIRGGKNREVLKHITEAGRIFDAWSDEEWVNEGAAVRVSLINFGPHASSSPPRLNGQVVHEIHADLTAPAEVGGADLTRAGKLAQNSRVCFYATVKAGSFDISGEIARRWLVQPNPNGRPNSDVVKPFVNGLDVVRRNADRWVVDFGVDTTQATAALYQDPYEHVLRVVKPERAQTRREKYRNNWWLFAEPIPGMRSALEGKDRYIATVAVSKHRTWSWIEGAVLADHALMVVARDDETTFGVLHSRAHEVWALRMGTSLEDRPRYTPTSCFETFPFPQGLTPNIVAADYSEDPRAQRIAEAARALVEARDRWLNPPEWTDRVPEVVPGYPDRIIAKPGQEADLKKRTLTNLYNARPAWLENLHRDLDAAVAAAYGWEWPLSDDDILRRLFELNQARSL